MAGYLCLYISVGMLWATFATKMHIKLRRKNKAIICFISNFLFWPIAMVVAIIRCPIHAELPKIKSGFDSSGMPYIDLTDKDTAIIFKKKFKRLENVKTIKEK